MVRTRTNIDLILKKSISKNNFFRICKIIMVKMQEKSVILRDFLPLRLHLNSLADLSLYRLACL